MEQAAKGSAGVIRPGSVQKMCPCGAQGSGLGVGLAVLG